MGLLVVVALASLLAIGSECTTSTSLEPGAYCDCFSVLKEKAEGGVQHTVDGVLDFFFVDRRKASFIFEQRNARN